MSSGSSSYVNGHGSGTSSGGNNIVGVGGALSFMGCVREASPPPHDYHHHHHTLVMDYMDVDRPNNNSLVKEPKKRRFHPLRGLRKIFRRKNRNAIDTEMITEIHEHSNDSMMCNKDELNVRHSDKRMEEIRSRSASELLKETCDRQSIFLRRSGVNETLSKRRGNSGQLSISHDSIFHGEVPHTRPLSSLDTLTPLERRHGKANDESAHNDYNSRAFFNHRISLRVIEQIKTAIENRHHVTLAECSNTSRTSRDCYQQEPTENYFTRGDKRDRIEELNEERCEIEDNKEEIWRTTQTLHQDAVDKKISPKADLPELESASLNHTAAHHRISVRPKNRRPPRRTVTATTNISCSIPCSTITTISECTDTVDSLEAGSSSNGSNASTPVEMKSVSIIRKSSSRVSRISDNSDELETKLPNIPANIVSVSPDSLDLSPIKIMLDNYETDDDHDVKCVVRKSSNRISKNLNDELDISDVKISRNFVTVSNKFIKSSDNIVNSFSNLSDSLNKSIDNKDVEPTLGKIQNFMSKSTDGFNLFNEQLEVKSIPKKIVSKSTEAFDTVDELEIPLNRGKYNYINQLTDISHAVSKSSDSLEVVEMTAASDDSIEHRRSSFEIRPRRNIKAISMSSDNFDTLEKSQQFNKRNSITDVHLSGVARHSRMTNKIISKSIESFDTTGINLNERKYSNSSSVDKNYWKISRRAINSDNSNNIEINDDHVENRKIQKPSKTINNSNTLDLPSENNIYTDDSKKPMVMKKLLSSRYRKSSDSSELGSNDTLDSVKQKLSDSTETIDSLEKDSDNNLTKDKYNKNNTSPMTTSENESDINNANNTNNKNHEDNVENKISTMSPDKSYWRQRSDSKENIDIHQLLAITIVSRISDNSNNQRNSGSFPKNKIVSSPTSPIVKQDGNKLLFNNLIVNNNDEELQNMLNGNISEVSIDTKSFKEKLIMFEKLGK